MAPISAIAIQATNISNQLEEVSPLRQRASLYASGSVNHPWELLCNLYIRGQIFHGSVKLRCLFFLTFLCCSSASYEVVLRLIKNHHTFLKQSDFFPAHPAINSNYLYSLIFRFNHSGFHHSVGSQYLSKQGKVFMQPSLMPLSKIYSFFSLLAPLLVAIFLESLGIESCSLHMSVKVKCLLKECYLSISSKHCALYVLKSIRYL